MFGPSSLLVLFLLTASPDDAGMAAASDQTSKVGTAIASGSGKATPVNYVGAAPIGDLSENNDPGTVPNEFVAKNKNLDTSATVRSSEDKKPSLLQAMLQDQGKSPFKEEESEPGHAVAVPPARLPSAPANPQPLQQQPPSATLPYPKLPGDVGCGPSGCTANSSSLSGCQPYTASSDRLALRNWFSDIGYEGWLDQGATVNPYSPRNRSNFPVGFNNRSNDYQLNQLYLRLKRDVNTQGGRWDVGGTVDLLYGTDSVFASSRGLEVDRNFGPKWNAQQYGLALPQCYMEVFAPWGDDGLTMKLGHFYANLGYETIPAPDNFFYSHSLSLLFGEPLTETGLLGEKRFENFKIQAGVTRGWDNWEDNNDDLSFLGGISWADDDDCSSLAFNFQSGPEQNEPPENSNFRNIFSLVFQQKLGERYQYVIQYDYGQEERNNIHLPAAKWLGLDQYLFYTISEQWKAGLRFEWFRDQDGVRVTGGRQGADYYELTAGLNWTPDCRVVVRPELRYDWVGTPNYTPYDDATRSYQFILDCDVIVKF